MPINRFHSLHFPILADQIAAVQEFMPDQAVITQAACSNRENPLNASRAEISISTVYINLLQQHFFLKAVSSKSGREASELFKL